MQGGRPKTTKEDLRAQLEMSRAFIQQFTSHNIHCERLISEQQGAVLLAACTCGYDAALERYKRALEDSALAKVLSKQENPFHGRLHV